MFGQTRLKGIRYILFDAVGTVIYPEPTVAEVYQQAAAESGLIIEQHVLKKRFKEVLAEDAGSGSLKTSPEGEEQRWRRIVGNVLCELEDSDAAFEKLWRHFAQPAAWRLFPGVTETWQRLQAYQPGIASNFDQRLHAVCAGLKPLDSASHIFTSAELGWAKPAAGFFRAIEQRLECEPHEIMLIGDDPVCDHQGAAAAGWKWAAATHQ